MARRYQIDELLWLRSSPLVSKPASLPPVEEWMGPLPERKPKDPINQNEPTTTTNRRPSLFETRHISRGSNSEDIILGPPKTAFASASRIAGGKGSIDATERPSRFQDSDESKNDRFNFRDKFFNREPGDRDFDKRDGKLGTFANRRGDKEDWNSGRPRRTFGPEDPERKPRRNGEFDRWEGRDIIRDRDPRESPFERVPRDKEGRFSLRKEGPPGRSRLDGSWFRDDNAQDGAEAEEDRPPLRNREWRRDRHGADRDWTRGAKFEQEPEWLDSTDREEPRPVHTQEDFERWKERMKAGSSQAQAGEKREAPEEPAPAAPQQSESRPSDGKIFSDDAAMERFFGLLTDQKPGQESPTAQTPVEPPSSKKETMPARSIKSSRFAGLFSPTPGTPTKETEQPQAKSKSPVNTPPSTTDADQEGFQRILQMLGSKGGSRNATPHNETIQPQRPSSLVQTEQGRSALSSPGREPLNRPDQMTAFHDTSARPTAPPGLQENFAQDPQAREREHLLRLMQQVRISPGPNPPGSQGPHSAGPAPGMLNMSEMLPHPPGIPTPQKGPNFLDDPAITNLQRPDPEQLRRRPANGPPPMGYFDDVLFPQGNNPMAPGGGRIPQGQGHPPMGIQRPPGFEHLPPPPGWTGQQLPPQQGGGPGPLAPPPGIPAPARGGMNPNFMSNVMPMHGNMPPLNERQAFPRGAGGSGAGAFGPPPGMMPPPGYMNMGGPPPSGLPPMPHNAEALMGLGHGGGPFGGNPGPQGPPPSSRHLLDMFGQASGGDGRGMMGPGQLRASLVAANAHTLEDPCSIQLTHKRVFRPITMMEKIDFELCLSVEKHAAAIPRRQKRKDSLSMDVYSSTKDMDGTATLGEDGRQEQEQGQEKGEKTGYRRSTKRAKISASGSWREGDQAGLDAIVPGVGQQQHASIIGSSSSSSTGTVDMDKGDGDDNSHENQDPDQEEDSISVPYLNRTSSTKKSLAKSPGASTPNSATRFTIYEDPDDRQFHTLALLPRLPESWHECPGDNKENMEDDLYDDDDGHEGFTPMDEFQSPEESDELNHPHFQHLLNINGYQPDGLLGFSHVDDVVRRRRFTPVEFAGVDTDVDMDMDMDVNEDSETVRVDHQMDNDSVNTTPASAPQSPGEAGDTTSTSTQTTPRHHNTRSPGSGEIEVDAEEDEMPRDSFRQRMSFLDAPPRRFLGRNGRRQVHWFMGV